MATEQQLDRLIDQIQLLINTLDRTGKTGASERTKQSEQLREFDKSLKTVVNAMAKLSLSIDGQKRTRAEEQAAMKRFTADVDRATKAQEEQTKAVQKSIEEEKEKAKQAAMTADELKKYRQEQERLRRQAQQIADEEYVSQAEKKRRDQNRAAFDAIQAERRDKYNSEGTITAARLFDEYGRGASVSATLRERWDSLGDTSLGLNASARLASAAFEGVSKALFSYGKALYGGEQGQTVAANAVKEFADTLGTAAQTIGAAMMFIPGLGIAARVAGAALSFLGTAGKAAADANKLIAEQSDRLYKSYQTLSEAGISAGDGMTGLAQSAVKLGYGLDEIGISAFNALMTAASKDLAMLSGTAIEGRKAFVGFTEDIVRSDIGRQLMNMGFSVDAINNGVAGFVKQQVSLGRAQAMTQAELKAGAALYLKDLDALTKLTGIQKKELEAQMDANRRNERFRAAIEKVRLEQGDDAAKALELNMAVASERFPDLAKGLMDIASGYVTSPEARKAFLAGMQDVPAMMTRGIGSGFNELNRAARDTTESFGHLAEVGRFGDVLGSYYEMMKAGGMTLEDFTKRAQEIVKEQEKQAAGADGVVGAQTDLRRAQMNTRDSLQNFVNMGVAPATSAMKSFSDTVNDVVRGLGGKPAGGAGSMTTGSGSSAGPGGGGPGGSGGAAPTSAQEGAATTTTGAKVFRGGIFGAIEDFVTGGQGFRSTYTEQGQRAAGTEQSILDLIGRVESRGNYNVLVGGKTKTDPPLTDMTVGEVMDFQSGMRSAGYETTAVGKYQIIRDTMGYLLQSGAVKMSDKFDQATQDRAASALLRRRGWEKFQAGDLSAKSFADNLAMEWAALPMEDGGSYYRGKGSNKALVARDDVMKAISAAKGGIATGPKTGYRAILHGAEAVVPLPDGKNIPVTLKMPMNMSLPTAESLDEINRDAPMAIVNALRNAISDIRSNQTASTGDASAAMLNELQNISTLLERQNTTSQRILQVARN